MTDELRERVRRSIRQHFRLLNRLEPHLPCILCHEPLTDGVCSECEEVADDV